VNDDVSAETCGGDDHGSEGVVGDNCDALCVSHAAQFRNVCDLQARIRHGLEVQDVRLPFHDRTLHAFQITDVHEGGANVAFPGEEVREEGVGPAVESGGGHHVPAGAAELEEDRGDGGHAAGGAVGGLRAFQGGHVAAQVEHRRVEVAAVDEEVAVGAQLASEHAAEGLRLHHRERSRGLDRHVHATVLPELVPRQGQCRRRVHVGCHHILPLSVVLRNDVVRAAALPVHHRAFSHFGRKCSEQERERDIELRKG